MARKPWWKYILFFLRAGAKAVEDGDVGAGKKTAKAGKIAGNILDEAGRIVAEDSEPKP